MAHFAKLGVGNIIETVHVVSNDIATTEQAGVDFLNNLYNTRDVWKQTSYNGNIRKNFAGVGYSYDQTRDAFIPPKPFNSWILNEDTCLWEAPVAYPITQTQNLTDRDGNPINDGYNWNEETTTWDLINE
mgnify:CR=1 FL=1